ncbi:MAG: hypothetical protein Q4F60_02665 [Candidatus Saccharibacteria bacterium]|nr:hypothetical protein [Candidatus Saccharibacteria bacterium]
MKNKNIKRNFLALGVAALMGGIFGGNVFAADESQWGPQDRPTFTWEEPASYITFNSITNNPEIGDERNFVRVREAGTSNKFEDTVHVEPGKEYEVYIWFHNNASANLAAKGIAQNVKLTSGFPTKLENGQAGQVKATISASNSNPTEVWDSAYLAADSTVYLSYVSNSAVIHSRGSIDGEIIDSQALFGKGANLGYDIRYWGLVPGCNEYAGYVVYRVKVDQPRWWSEKLVKNGDGEWQEWLNAQPGDTLDFKINYKNTGTVKQEAVKLFDVLPAELELVEGSVYQRSDNFAEGVTVGSELFSESGLVIGDFYPGQTATVTYQAKVKDTVACGETKIYNAMRSVTANGTENDKVEITVVKDCSKPTCETNPEMEGCQETVEDCETNPNLPGCQNPAPTPTVDQCLNNPTLPGCETVTVIPETGPAEVAFAAIIVVLIAVGGGYWLQSYLKLNKATKGVTGKKSDEVKDGIVKKQ